MGEYKGSQQGCLSSTVVATGCQCPGATEGLHPALFPDACVWVMGQRVRLQGAPLSHDAIGLEPGVGRTWGGCPGSAAASGVWL